MSTFDWCLRNQHEQCRKSYTKFWWEKRKRKEVLVFADEETFCECPCHAPESVVDSDKKPKTRAARRKK